MTTYLLNYCKKYTTNYRISVHHLIYYYRIFLLIIYNSPYNKDFTEIHPEKRLY